ncbi:helix-turn-helix transcriptional regulator [Naasia aerilata]|uniref:helix-turn-helix transcriptional regulator n=1 Tax=Naasia aerilata TaxID=1162966 RepID=UPI00257286C2|nr:helix-turn-helix transcriptional regulator [Naasia aerilata]
MGLRARRRFRGRRRREGRSWTRHRRPDLGRLPAREPRRRARRGAAGHDATARLRARPARLTVRRGAPAGRADPATGPVRVREEGARQDTGLSAREREVARLVLDGKNYREIGEAIFISPRTVEHHVARIRQRLDATTRSDLLAQLRLALDTDDPE